MSIISRCKSSVTPYLTAGGGSTLRNNQSRDPNVKYGISAKGQKVKETKKHERKQILYRGLVSYTPGGDPRGQQKWNSEAVECRIETR